MTTARQALGPVHLAVLALLVAAGVAVRWWIVFNTDGVYFDLNSYHLVYDGLKAHGFAVYGSVPRANWPYPPGYFPWVLFAGDQLTRWYDFEEAIRLGAVAADVGLVLLVQDLLGRAGAAPSRRLAGAALVALGPVFVNVAGFNGQVDPAATLFALAAYWVWTRPGQRHRALLAGVLVGIGACVKTVPILVLLPLVFTATSRREAVVLVGAAFAVLFVAVAPFNAETPYAVQQVGRYAGIPGFGGISLLLDPTFSADVLSGTEHGDAPVLVALAEAGPGIVLLPALAALAVLLWRRRPDALTGICLLWLVVYAFGVSFAVAYLVWALPFLIVRGHLVAVAAVQLVFLPAQLVLFNAPVDRTLALVAYTGVLAAAWLALLAVLVAWVRRIPRDARAVG